jgi:hypothetical protein
VGKIGGTLPFLTSVLASILDLRRMIARLGLASYKTHGEGIGRAAQTVNGLGLDYVPELAHLQQEILFQSFVLMHKQVPLLEA